jgi:hypothetical protein
MKTLITIVGILLACAYVAAYVAGFNAGHRVGYDEATGWWLSKKTSISQELHELAESKGCGEI